VRQVQRFLGHHSPSFTLDTYVHLLDEGVGEPLSLDGELAKVGNGWATSATEPDRNGSVPVGSETPDLQEVS
jgi:hypothetical protein